MGLPSSDCEGLELRRQKTFGLIVHRFVPRFFSSQSGSFCNPGACQSSYPLTGAQIRRNLESGYACWEDGENLHGVVNGSVRVTLGWCTRWEDVNRFMTFVEGTMKAVGSHCFVSGGQPVDSGVAPAIALSA